MTKNVIFKKDKNRIIIKTCNEMQYESQKLREYIILDIKIILFFKKFMLTIKFNIIDFAKMKKIIEMQNYLIH